MVIGIEFTLELLYRQAIAITKEQEPRVLRRKHERRDRVASRPALEDSLGRPSS